MKTTNSMTMKKIGFALVEMHPKKNEKLSNHNGIILVRKNLYNSEHFNFVIQKNPPDEDTFFSYLRKLRYLPVFTLIILLLCFLYKYTCILSFFI